jgi:hypothetical protein
MTEADRVCFCTVCLNRKEINQRNLLCGLTGKDADFETSCKDFNLDLKKKKSIVDVYRKEVIESINKDQRFRLGNEVRLSFLFSDKDKEKLNKKTFTDSDFNEVIVSVTRKKKYDILLGAVVFFVIGTLLTVMDIKIDKKYSYDTLVICLAISLTLLVIFFLEYEKFRISQQGIKRRNKLIPWYQIDFAHFKTIRSKSTTEIFLVLRMTSGGTKTIDITTCDKDAQELGQIVYSFLKRFGTN